MMFAIMLPFSQLNSLMSSFLQCSGDMVTPSILNAVMCVLDVIFNALLIPVFGVMGAGMGTMLACAVISSRVPGSVVSAIRGCVSAGRKKRFLIRKF